jgi:hypothetical protein
MSRNVKASKRGFGYDSITKTLDVFADGVRVTKLAGDSPNIYSESATQLYPLGTRLQVDDRVFRYCRAGSAIDRFIAGANTDQWTLTNEEPNASAAAGATSMSVVNTTATINQYAGGWVVIFTDPLQMRRILANDASDGTDTTVYLDGGLEEAVTKDSTWVTGYPSIYYDVRSPATISSYVDYISFVCVPVINVTSTYYFWGQTWGPCYGVADVTVPGSAANQREIYFATSGNLSDYGDNEAGTGAQYAGFLLPRTSSGAGDQLYMLQLAP